MLNRSLARKLVLFGLIAMGGTACAVQGSAGIFGLALSSSLVTLILLFVGGAQSGCVGPCLSPPAPDIPYPDAGQGGDVGPCLSPPLSGEEVYAGEIGPCLSVIPPDMNIPADQDPPANDEGMSQDMGIGEEMGMDEDVGVGGDMEMDEDIGVGEDMDIRNDLGGMQEIDGSVGPCLSPPAPDDMGRPIPEPDPDRPEQKSAARHLPQRADVIAHLSEKNALPADVLARLKRK